MRGADGGPWRRLCALPALWVGLLYESDCQTAAWDLVKNWTIDDHTSLRANVPRNGLQTQIRGTTVQEIALQVLDIAEQGLQRRAIRDHRGNDETGFLAILREIAERGYSASGELLQLYATKWESNVDPIYTEFAY